MITALTARLDARLLGSDPNVGLVLHDICAAPSTSAADRARAAALATRLSPSARLSAP